MGRIKPHINVEVGGFRCNCIGVCRRQLHAIVSKLFQPAYERTTTLNPCRHLSACDLERSTFGSSHSSSTEQASYRPTQLT
jgi:hypothetical protein